MASVMNAAHWHLVLNHIPVLGTGFGIGLLAFAVWRRSAELKRAALGLFVLIGLVAVPAYLTGEPAGDSVASLPGVSKSLMDHHEDAANVAFVGVLLLGVGALLGLIGFRKREMVPGWFASVILAASLIVSGLMAWTANLGGQVRHTEIRSGASGTAVDKD